ncbi:MAG: CvpA family protein [Bacilli bacterium]|nr:CvpA family protein [Bacilli bacterium]
MDFLSINVIDVVIVLMILLAGVVGLKRGFFREIVMTIGYFLLIIISFWIKTPIGEFLAENLPFLTFGGKLIYMPVVNIVFYQMIAFIVVFAILAILFNVILITSKVLEKILDATIVLGLVSKILGFFVGLIEGYIIMYFVCILLSFPVFNQTVVAESKLKNDMLSNTPILSKYTGGLVRTVDGIVDLTKDFKEDNADDFNLKAVELMLDNKMVTKEHIIKLIDQNKLDTPGMRELAESYK